MSNDAYQKRLQFFMQRMRDIPGDELRRQAADRAISNQDRYYALLRSTGLEGMENLISAIHRSTFTTARSHSHHKYPSGTMEHCLGVYDLMKSSEEAKSLDEKQLILVGLLHDISMGRNPEWKDLHGIHGEKSRSIVERYLPDVRKLEYAEAMLAIQRHRHDAVGNHPLWALVRRCDQKDASTCNSGYAFLKLKE